MSVEQFVEFKRTGRGCSSRPRGDGRRSLACPSAQGQTLAITFEGHRLSQRMRLQRIFKIITIPTKSVEQRQTLF